MEIDRTPKKLTPEAWEILKETKDVKRGMAAIGEHMIEALKIKQQYRAEIKEAADRLRHLLSRQEREIEVLQEKAKEEARKADLSYGRILDRAREVMPELNKFEFTFDIDEGTYTPTDERELTPHLNSRPEEAASEEQNTKASSIVKNLIGKIMKEGE